MDERTGNIEQFAADVRMPDYYVPLTPRRAGVLSNHASKVRRRIYQSLKQAAVKAFKREAGRRLTDAEMDLVKSLAVSRMAAQLASA